MILGLDVGQIISLSLTLLISLLIPLAKRMRTSALKKQKKDQEICVFIKETAAATKKIEERLDKNEKTLETIMNDMEKQNEEIEKYQILDIKYMINDTFLGYNNVHEVPYENLIVAIEGCDIYTSKGYNHEIGARCKILCEEFERREKMKGEGGEV